MLVENNSRKRSGLGIDLNFLDAWAWFLGDEKIFNRNNTYHVRHDRCGYRDTLPAVVAESL